MRQAKAACRGEYDSFVAGVVRDSKGSPDADSAASKARAFLDEIDAGVVIGPPAPAKLAHLPVERFVGAWRLGRGPLAVDLKVRFTESGSLVGIFETALNPHRLKSWKIMSDGTKHAVLHASFADGRIVKYDRIPSFPGEIDFINSADPAIQRFALTVEDNDLLIRLVAPEHGTQLRFSRQIDTAE